MIFDFDTDTPTSWRVFLIWPTVVKGFFLLLSSTTVVFSCSSRSFGVAEVTSVFDFEKAFDGVHHELLWKLMAHYGIPPNIKNMYQDMQCRVLHQGCAQETFKVLTGVKQGCLLPPFLFLLCIDWILKQTTHNKKTGIKWSLTEHLEDLDFADDIALLSHTHTPTDAREVPAAGNKCSRTWAQNKWTTNQNHADKQQKHESHNHRRPDTGRGR